MGQYAGGIPNEVTIGTETDTYGQIDVIAGWDPNLDRYYFLVEVVDSESEDSKYLYNNLDDPRSPQPFSAAASGVDYFKHIWNSLNLGEPLPETFWKEFAQTRFAVPPNPNLAHFMNR